MRLRRRIDALALVALIGAALLLVGMAGCDAATSATSATTKPVPTTTPSATASPSPTYSVVVRAVPRVPAASTAGWATYRDPQFALQVPLPPGWRAGAFTTSTPGGPTYYIVQFFPPQSQGQPGLGAVEKEPELIQITVMTAPPYTTVAGNPSWFAEASPVSIGGTPSTLYDRYNSGEEVSLSAGLMHGALQFTFNLNVMFVNYSVELDPAEVNRDTSLYLGMMQGFSLTKV